MQAQNNPVEQWERQAFELGQQAARDVATWTVDGNTPPEHARRVLAMLEDGDPEAFDHLPTRPSLSGEWADDPTPRSLFEDVTDLDAHAEATWNVDAYSAVVEALCDAYERGVDETFEAACGAELRRIVEVQS